MTERFPGAKDVHSGQKEYQSWLAWGCITPVEKEITLIKKTPSTRKRIVPSRNAYRDKLRGAGPRIKAKGRTVILGCLDPDLALLNRASPTPSKLAELVLLQLATAGFSGLVECTSKHCHRSTAFLQGASRAARSANLDASTS